MHANTTAEIIQFPKPYVSAQDPQEVINNLTQMKAMSCEEVLSFLVPTFFEALITAGFAIDDDRLNSLVVALTRAIMYRHYGLEHPIFPFIEQHQAELDAIMQAQENYPLQTSVGFMLNDDFMIAIDESALENADDEVALDD